MLQNLTAIISMLHEGADRNSATRAFRDQSVLAWTLRRLSLAQRVSEKAIVCWEDQLPYVAPVAESAGAFVLAKGPRVRLAEVESVTAARRWADGWRGGLLGTCAFDLGFYGPWVLELATRMAADAVVLIDPASALIDPQLIDGLISHAEIRPELDMCFAPAAPGLSGVLLREPLLSRLAAARTHAGRLLHYMPDQNSREVLGGESCAPVPAAVARTTCRFTIDSDRQLQRIMHATEVLNGQLILTGAEDLVRRVQTAPWLDPLPREVVLELNTNRATKPIFQPGGSRDLPREPVNDDWIDGLMKELGSAEDTRLTIAGAGDPLLHPGRLAQVIEKGRAAGIRAIHVETDLLPERVETIGELVRAPVDVVSVFIPATSPATYETVMGVDAYRRVLENVQLFVSERQQRGAGVPLLVPVFIKCRQNLGEMELWYDQWLRALQCGVVRGPSTFGGLIEEIAVADMAPPRRHPCVRLTSRLTILKDGRVVSCEEDAMGRQSLGKLGGGQSLADIWRNGFASMREDHQRSEFAKHPVCGKCTEWHRP